MERLEQLLDLLDATKSADREAVYAATEIALSLEDVHRAAQKGRRCAGWLATRLCVGPPGIALPTVEESWTRMSKDEGGAVEAYVLLFEAAPLDPRGPPLHSLLHHCTAVAWNDIGGNYLTTMMVVWDVLAAFAAGEDELLRGWNDIGAKKGERPPGFEHFDPLIKLQDHEALYLSVHTRRVVCGHWAGPPSMPELPSPSGDDEEMGRGDWLRAVEALGDPGLSSWAEEGLHAWDRRISARLEAHPAIQAVRAAVLEGAEQPPAVESLPPELDVWILTVSTRGEWAAARLASLMAWRAGVLPAEKLSLALLADLHASDLPLLEEHGPDEVEAMARELREVLPLVPTELRKELLTMAFPLNPASVDAAVRMVPRLSMLEDALPDPGPWMQSMLAWVRSLATDDGTAFSTREDLHEAVAAIVEGLPPATLVSSEQLVRAVNEAELIPPVCDITALLAYEDPFHRLVAAMVQRRGIQCTQGTDDDIGMLAVLADMATRAIMDVGNRLLFELRLELLPEVIADARSTHERVVAKLALANTTSGVAANDPAGWREANALFEDALADAERLGDPDLYANAAAMWARQLRHGGLDQAELSEALRRRALQVLDHALSLEISMEMRSKALFSKAVVLFHPGPDLGGGDPVMCAELMGRAIQLSEDDRWRYDMLREQSSCWLAAGRTKEAEACLERCVDEGRDHIPPDDMGLVLADLGRLVAARDPETAEQHLRDAVRKASHTTDWGYCVLRLAEHLMQTARSEEALKHVRRLCSQIDRAPATHHGDALRLAMVLELHHGDPVAAAEAKDRALSVTSGTFMEALVHLQWAEGARTSPEALDTALAYIEGTLGPASPIADGLVASLLSSHIQSLSRETHGVLLAWSQERHQIFLEASLLDTLGQRSAALERLSAAIAEADGMSRTQLRILRIAMLPAKPPDALRAELDSIQREVPGLAALPLQALCDYATGCRLASQGEPGWLDRSVAAWRSAYDRGAQGDYSGHIATGWVYAALDSIRGEQPASTPAIAAQLDKLLPVCGAGAGQWLEGLFELLALVLLPGALTHPAVLDASARLLEATPAHPWADAMAARLQSIQAAASDPNTAIWSLPGEVEATEPFDDSPHPWLVAIITADCDEPAPEAVVGDVTTLMLACKVRPDRADALLSCGARAAGGMPEDAQTSLVSAAAYLIQEAPFGENVWPSLWEAAQELPDAFVGRGTLLHHLRRARHYRDGEGPAPGEEEQGVRSAQQRFDEAVRAMDRARQAQQERAAELKAHAVQLLEGLASECEGPFASGVHISLGNARRLEPDPDYDGAIDCYRQVEDFGDQNSSEDLGRLYKVWADALRQRGGAGDLITAWDKIQLALRHRRSGRLRAETLVSAANIARTRSDWDRAHQARETGKAMLEATRCSPSDMERLLTQVLFAMADWKRQDPASFDSAGARAELLERYPAAASRIEQASSGLAQDSVGTGTVDREATESIRALFEDPAGAFYMNHRRTLEKTDIHLADHVLAELHQEAARRGIDPAEFEARRRGDYIGDNAEALSTLLSSLEGSPDDTRVGAAMVRVEIMAALARLQAGDVTAVREATDQTATLIRAEASFEVAPFFFDRLAKVWAPDETVANPVRDFDLAVELAREAVGLGGGEERADRDQLVALARALRYRGGDQPGPDLEEARRLYERALVLDRRAGSASSTSNTLHMLADLLQYCGHGDREQRLREVAKLEREAVELAINSEWRARFQANLAWTLSSLAGVVTEHEESTALYHESVRLYRAALEHLPEGHNRANTVQNMLTTQASQATQRGDIQGAIRIERDRLASLSPKAHPELVAKARHNLAHNLTYSPDRSDVEEAVVLMRQALAYRRPELILRQHWESSLGLAEAILHLAERGGGIDQAQFDEALEALSGGAQAARTLGLGEELNRVGIDLARLALLSDDLEKARAVAEEARGILSESMPYLLLNRHAASREGQLAMTLCFHLAGLASRQGLVGTLDGGFMLGSAGTQLVLRWWLRAQAAWRRRLRARTDTPRDASLEDIRTLRQCIKQDDAVGAVERLRAIHRDAPGWLSEEEDLAGTRRWLKAHQATGVAVWPGQGGFLVALLGVQPKGDRVLLLPAPIIPMDEQGLAKLLRDPEQRAQILDSITAWAQQTLLPRLRKALGRVPKQILWCPHGILRLLPPSALFERVPVSVAASLALDSSPPRRARSDKLLVVVAEPADAPMGRSIFDKAAQLASQGEPARMLFGRDACSGTALHPQALNAHPSADNVLRELDDASLAVIIAHGTAETAEDAWLHLLREDGSEDRLDVQALMADPGVVDGLRVILLACESGRTGDRPNQPGGIAGALISAGAKEVVAPLWPVSVPNATAVGRALLEGRAQGKGFAQVLARLDGLPCVTGPQLGRVSKAKKAAAHWDKAAFVSWVG